MMKHLNQIFFKGLIVVLPITLTFYFLYWASVKVESLFSGVLEILLGEELYIPGLGIILTMAIIFLVGVLVSNFITARFFTFFTNLLEKVPLIKVIYNPLKVDNVKTISFWGLYRGSVILSMIAAPFLIIGGAYLLYIGT